MISPAQAQLPPLQHQEVLDGVPLPTSMVFLPDGRALVISLQGKVWITSPMDQLPVTFDLWLSLDTNINNSAEHGLLEILLDPGFQSNNYVYLYWSTRENKNRLSRFVHLTDSTNMSTETVIYETPDEFTGCCHIGGAASFLNDGTIILSIGDDFQPLLAQDMSSPFGKAHRINADGTTPSSNPYYDGTPGIYNANGTLKTIYASGIRNPFRGAYDEDTEMFLIGEVGSNDHTTAWEDTHELVAGANFGWPYCGGTGRDSFGNCSDPAFEDPLLTYPHDGTGASITSGCFYRNGSWPSSWDGRYFYGDFVRGWIKYVEFDASGNVINEQPVIDESVYPGLNAEFIVKMLVGPDGNLYYLILYDDFVNGTGSIHRLINTPNQLPQCDSIWADPSFGAGPNMQVEFGGTVSDPEGYPLSYTWVFGDGSPDATILNATHNYVNYGTYEAELIVEDDQHIHSCGQISITVGQAPEVQITSPANGSTFHAGTVVNFEGIFSDDGPITVADLEWNVVFNHDSHIHPVSGAVGVDDYDLIIPTTGHDFTGNTWYTVTLTVVDEDGLTSSHSVEIFPEKETVTIESTPPGLEILIDNIPYFTPYVEDHAIGTELAISVPIDQQCLAGSGYLFQQWTGGQPGTFLHAVPAMPSLLSAQFMNDGPCDHCGSAVDFDGNDDFLSLDSLPLNGDMTIEFWLQLDAVISATDVVLGNEDSFSIDMTAGKLTIYHGAVKAQSSVVAAPNQWNHYALVRGAGSWDIYINGVLDAGATSVSNHNADLYIRHFGKSFRPNGLDGSLDEMRIWNVPRSVSNIQQNIDVLIDPFQLDLELYWRFDQPFASQNISDLSGHGHVGQAGVDNLPGTDEPTFYDPNGPMGLSCVRDVAIDLKVRLEGPSSVGAPLMKDDLRVQGLLPLTEPYTDLGFNLPGSGGETIAANVLAVTGSDAIVDWIVVEIRDPDAPENVLDTRIGLLQRDGDVVALDGVNVLTFSIERPDFNVAVRHRNHFGVMVNTPTQFGGPGSTVSIDMSSGATNMYGAGARKNMAGSYALWSGNTTGDEFIKYAGAGNDRDPILVGVGGVVPTAVFLGYSVLDLNLDGVVKYAGQNNDRDMILVNIGGNIPTSVKQEQLP